MRWIVHLRMVTIAVWLRNIPTAQQRLSLWRDPSDWTGLNCSSASFGWFFLLGFLVALSIESGQQTGASRLIHNRPGPVRCENAWYRSVTSQQCAGPEKGDCG